MQQRSSCKLESTRNILVVMDMAVPTQVVSLVVSATNTLHKVELLFSSRWLSTLKPLILTILLTGNKGPRVA